MTTNTKFIHLRAIQRNTDDIAPFGGATIAYRLDGQKIHYSVARCHSHDRYEKKIGRCVSEGRLNSGKQTTIALDPHRSVQETIMEDAFSVR